MIPGSRDSLIVDGIVRLAEALDVDVIAEGVESEQQGVELVRMGCRAAQGYFFARPVADAGFAAAVLAARGPWEWGGPEVSDSVASDRLLSDRGGPDGGPDPASIEAAR